MNSRPVLQHSTKSWDRKNIPSTSSSVALEYDWEPRPRSRNCTDLNRPKINTLNQSVKNIQQAIGNLQFLPVEIERYVRTDPILRARIEQALTKTLNVQPKATIYKDLVSIEAPIAEKVKSAEEFQRKIAARQPPPKLKDSEPNILDFNKPTFSRIKPQLPDPPPKPRKGVSAEIDDDFLLLFKEIEFGTDLGTTLRG